MKVFIVSTLQPFGHYTQILTNSLTRNSDLEVFVAAEKNPANKTLQGCGTVFPVWEKGPFFFVPILKKILQTKPDIIHLQHEFMMYGGAVSAVMFPLFLAVLKMLGYPVVVTIHAVLDLDNMNDDFVSAFHLKSILAKPFFLRKFFTFILWFIGLTTDGIVCHTERAVHLLEKQYRVSKKKIHVIPACIPEKKVHNRNPEKYFLYFGYITPRKGLETVISAFSDFQKKHTGYRFIIAGGTIRGQETYVESIKKLITPCPAIEFRGEIIDESELDFLYEKAYAVINPALINVGSSGPLYQARGYHSCILASDVDHLKEDISHLKNGMLIDNNHWADAFEMITNDRKLRDMLIKNTIHLAKSRNPENTAVQYFNYYSRILAL
ncbi:glycosyltransferase family 4 protein [Candidatus Roizmanbacteria bacterium]|nr:MAG: glycosyltransferase family 4 protein [Candidatus Roizmanbacteria bacterium]